MPRFQAAVKEVSGASPRATETSSQYGPGTGQLHDSQTGVPAQTPTQELSRGTGQAKLITGSGLRPGSHQNKHPSISRSSQLPSGLLAKPSAEWRISNNPLEDFYQWTGPNDVRKPYPKNQDLIWDLSRDQDTASIAHLKKKKKKICVYILVEVTSVFKHHF